jgi:hypothetical protein
MNHKSTIQKHLIWSALTAGLLAATPTLALPSGPLHFTVLRDGSEIGTHDIDVHRDGNETRVDVATDIAVKIAFVTLYRFEHDGHEVWRDGRLVQIDSKTDDDGTSKSLHGELGNRGLHVEGSAQKFIADTPIVPASLWNDDIVRQGRLLNTLDGSEMEVSIRLVGDETVAVHGKQVPARHYDISGQLNREVWFDADGTLVQVRFKAEDDSDIRYVLN